MQCCSRPQHAQPSQLLFLEYWFTLYKVFLLLSLHTPPLYAKAVGYTTASHVLKSRTERAACQYQDTRSDRHVFSHSPPGASCNNQSSSTLHLHQKHKIVCSPVDDHQALKGKERTGIKSTVSTIYATGVVSDSMNTESLMIEKDEQFLCLTGLSAADNVSSHGNRACSPKW